jgi:cation:H+ antiporter
VLVGVVAMVGGAVVLVDATRHLAHAERGQTVLGLTIIGFATGFELVALAWSSARRGQSEALLAGVLGSFVYNSTMTLGVAALARPLHLRHAGSLHLPLVLMLLALAAVLWLGWRGMAPRRAGVALLTGYAVFAATVAVFVSGPR